jgi:hypothetical protein
MPKVRDLEKIRRAEGKLAELYHHYIKALAARPYENMLAELYNDECRKHSEFVFDCYRSILNAIRRILVTSVVS